MLWCTHKGPRALTRSLCPVRHHQTRLYLSRILELRILTDNNLNNSGIKHFCETLIHPEGPKISSLSLIGETLLIPNFRHSRSNTANIMDPDASETLRDAIIHPLGLNDLTELNLSGLVVQAWLEASDSFCVFRKPVEPCWCEAYL